ncbi:MAG: 1-acyl-sn-glycerol-3-phosphate acyltransferase, partial [Victivallales bacterium]|nr:1-acyl-sn-glycerol-3-phosphate acyltransferase [Victivallales bacterium]
MLYYLVALVLKSLLWLRYRVKVTGLDEVVKGGRKGVLFLPNHPALIDPVILSTVLAFKFRPRPLVDVKQVRGSMLKYIKGIVGVLELPDLGILGSVGKEKVLEQIGNCVEALKAGDNLLMYPAGRLYRTRYEKLRGNGGVERILNMYPDVRIVLVRTT